MNNNTLTIPDKIFGIESALLVTFVPLAVLAGAILLSLNLVIVPKYEDFWAMVGEVKNLERQNQTIIEKTRYIQSIDPEELSKNSILINNALLPQKNAYVLVNVIKKVAANFNFQIDSFSISPGELDKPDEAAKSAKGIASIPIKITIVGPKMAYVELVKGLERTLPVLSIKDFKMISQGSLVKLDMEIAASYIEDNSKFDISRLTLADLTLKKEETDLVATISQYSIIEKMAEEQAAPEYVKYNRTDPFTP